MKAFNRMRPATLADSIGQIKAAIAELNTELKTARSALAGKAGTTSVTEGDVFRVVLTDKSTTSTDWKGIVEELSEFVRDDLLAEVVERNTKRGETNEMKVTARTAKSRAA